MQSLSQLEKGTVYLIHLDKLYGNQLHYLGWSSTNSLAQRIRRHRLNEGARFLRCVNEAKIGWRVVRIWPGMTTVDERKMKKSNQLKRLCPVCNEVSGNE